MITFNNYFNKNMIYKNKFKMNNLLRKIKLLIITNRLIVQIIIIKIFYKWIIIFKTKI